MSVIRISYVQQASTPNAEQATPTQAEIRDQIRQTILDAQAAARDAQTAAREAPGAAREAQAAAREAQAAARDLQHNMPFIVRGGPGQPLIVQRGGGNDGIPPQAVEMANGFFVMCAVIAIGWPLARAFGRRIERRGTTTVTDPAMASQLQRIEQAVEAMSIEVERISESQRFMAKLQSGTGGERGAVPSMDRR